MSKSKILGCRQAVRHQTLTLTLPGFESLHPSQKEQPSNPGGCSFFVCWLFCVMLCKLQDVAEFDSLEILFCTFWQNRRLYFAVLVLLICKLLVYNYYTIKFWVEKAMNLWYNQSEQSNKLGFIEMFALTMRDSFASLLQKRPPCA